MLIPSYLVTLSALLFVSCGPTAAQSVAVFDFELIDTSLEGGIRGARADEQERLTRLSDQLRQLLGLSVTRERQRARGHARLPHWRSSIQRPTPLLWFPKRHLELNPGPSG
jgi:Protein of unknown function (DUF2380)